MIIGDASVFAIESGITQAYERLGFRALGFFVIHVDGRRYGVHEPDATMLACSFDQVERRIAHRGEHTAPFAAELDAGKIADLFRNTVYTDEPYESYLGVPLEELRDLFCTQSHSPVWAPDGDEAFDDGSYVLQFDFQDRVRLIAFKCGQGYLHDPATLREVWLAGDEFYCILQQWRDAFEAEWRISPKISIATDGAS